MRTILLALLVSGCSAPLDPPVDDVGHPIGKEAGPQATDAAGDEPIVEDADVPEVVVVDSGAPDSPVVVKGGDVCPIQSLADPKCVNGFEYRVHGADGGVDYPCGGYTPHCPSGWICWTLNSQNQHVQAICP